MTYDIDPNVITMHPFLDNGVRVTPDFDSSTSWADVWRWYMDDDARRVSLAFEQRRERFKLESILNNQIARQMMGWHLAADDPQAVWRRADGSKVVATDSVGDAWEVCAHPYRFGVNTFEQMSFNPILNYHPNRLDWVEYVLEQLQGRSHLLPLRTHSSGQRPALTIVASSEPRIIRRS